MGNFKRPQALSTREVGQEVHAWEVKRGKAKGTKPKKLRASPKNLHVSRAKRQQLENQKFVRKLQNRELDKPGQKE